MPKSSIVDVDSKIRVEAGLAVRREHLDGFVGQLEGWWFRTGPHKVDSLPDVLQGCLETEFSNHRS